MDLEKVVTMTMQVTPKILRQIRANFLDGSYCESVTLGELREFGLDAALRESVIELWKDQKVVADGTQHANDLIIELYAKLEAMGKVNPIIQTLKNIHVRMMIITNQAHGIASLLIPFASIYPDIPTTSELESICSAIDDLPLAFLEHFALELDTLRVHDRTTKAWLEALEHGYPTADLDELIANAKKVLGEDEPREPADPKLYWKCAECGEMVYDAEVCKCGWTAPWIRHVRLVDDEEEYPL